MSRRKFGEFRKRNPKYLVGEGEGYVVRALDEICYEFNGFHSYSCISWDLGMLARRTRWSSQLRKIFTFYLKNDGGDTFNNSYIGNNSGVKSEYGTMGCNLLQNVRSNKSMACGMDEIVRLVSLVEPKILKYYESPEYRKIKKNVVRTLKIDK